MNVKRRECIKIGNSQGFIIPKEEEEPVLGKKYDLELKPSEVTKDDQPVRTPASETTPARDSGEIDPPDDSEIADQPL